MYPRKTLDIDWSDFAFAAGACLRPGDPEREARRLEALWSGGEDDVLATLSVRSAFDLFLETLSLSEGSEILVSAVTIRDMVRIIERHGLVAVPVDMDMARLAVREDALERAAGPRSRAILVAHLFGSRMPLDRVADFARRRNLLLLEDCAQAFMADGYRGHPGSDVVFFSFGPIKSRTALGGGVVRVRDRHVLARMRGIQEGWPAQGRRWFLARTIKYAAVALVLTPTGMRLLAVDARLAGRSHDEVLSGAVRGFPGPGFFHRIRRRPPFPLLALLRRRLRTVRSREYRERSERGRHAARLLGRLSRPGSAARVHSHWVFPVCVDDPDGLMRFLWRAGFDATRGASSLAAVRPAPSRPDVEAREARRTMDRVLYLPVHSGLNEAALRELAQVVEAWDDRTAARGPSTDEGGPTSRSSVGGSRV